MTLTLDVALATAFACLAEGAADPGSVWHTPTLANLDDAGFASQRSVVMRGWDQAARVIEIHTDIRSAKYEAFEENPKASLHGWDSARRIRQHTNDVVAQAAWQRLRPASRATYGVLPGPGTALRHPHDTRQSDEIQSFAAFCVIQMTVHDLEWLRLEQGSHARARFHWDNGIQASTWLVP
jgi:pyridoxamine 5'-phosphate oxidase